MAARNGTNRRLTAARGTGAKPPARRLIDARNARKEREKWRARWGRLKALFSPLTSKLNRFADSQFETVSERLDGKGDKEKPRDKRAEFLRKHAGLPPEIGLRVRVGAHLHSPVTDISGRRVGQSRDEIVHITGKRGAFSVHPEDLVYTQNAISEIEGELARLRRIAGLNAKVGISGKVFCLPAPHPFDRRREVLEADRALRAAWGHFSRAAYYGKQFRKAWQNIEIDSRHMAGLAPAAYKARLASCLDARIGRMEKYLETLRQLDEFKKSQAKR